MIEQALLLDNPFPGLRPFDTDESDRFFGRDGQSDEVLSKLRRARFVAVVGTSGSGKSSLVRAGVLPALYSGHLTSAGSHWRVAIFRPGDDPVGNLADALSKPEVLGGRFADAGEARREIEATLRASSLGLVQAITDAHMEPHENLLLVADQFEELFRFRQKIKAERPEDEAAAFIKLLLEARASGRASALPVYLILTMRSDYLGEAAQFRGLPEAINEGQYLIPRMNDDEWREAITGPVWMHGAQITPQLVNRLLNDAGDRTLLKSAGEHADRLPILQHALMRTWEYWRAHRRGDEPIDIPHYLRVGGMAGALSRHADEAFFELPQRQQAVAEELFRRLTEKGSDGREGRRPATVGEICAIVRVSTDGSEDDVRAVIESFRRAGRSFLMPPPPAPLTPDTLIDISHESLIWGWERLRQWVDKEADCARILMRLSETASLHASGQEGYLRNPALQVALDWREKHHPNSAWAARYCPNFDQALAFLEASQADFQREETEREQQRQRELAQAQALADERQRRVKLQRIGLIILTALLLGLAGLTVFAFQQKSEAVSQRNEAVRQRNLAQQAFEKEREAVVAMQESQRQRDESLNKALVEQKKAKAQKVEADRQRNTAQQALVVAKEAKSEADKQRAIAVERQQEAEKQKDEATKALALVKEIDSSAPFYKTVMRDDTAPVTSVAISPDGRSVLTGNFAGFYKTRSAGTGADDHRRVGAAPSGAQRGAINSVAFSHDGRRVLVAGDYGTTLIRGWGGAATLLRKHTDRINYAAFSPDDQFVVTASADRTACVFDATTGQPKSIIEHKGAVNHAAFSPDGKLVVTSSDDGTAIVSRMDEAALDRSASVTRADGTVEISNTLQPRNANPSQITLRVGLARVNRAAFSHSGKFIVTASADGLVIVWDARTGKKVLDLAGHMAEVNTAIFSPDDKLIVTASNDRTARIWEFEEAYERKQHEDGDSALAQDRRAQQTAQQGLSPEQIKALLTSVDLVKSIVLSSHEAEVNNAIFSPDGRWVITASHDRTARVWQAVKEGRHAAGEQLAVLRGHIGPVTSLDFNAENKYIVTGSADRTVRVWDVSNLGGLAVSAAVKSDPPKFAGDCPVTIKLTGTVNVEGSGGTVKYQFITNDGELGKPQEIVFDSPGTKEVSETWTINGTRPSAWVAIKILDPQPQESAHADISVTCRNYERTVATAAPLTEDALRQIVPSLSPEKRQFYLPYLRQAMDEFKINTPARQAAFLAQIAHESGELKFMEEIWGPTAAQNQYEPSGKLAASLGNTQQGDGKRFKGRGAIQIVGRAKYQEYGQRIGLDLVNNPDLAATTQVAFRLAGAIWQNLGLNELADSQEFITITKRIDGGLNGIASRQKYYSIAKQVLGVSDVYQQKQEK